MIRSYQRPAVLVQAVAPVLEAPVPEAEARKDDRPAAEAVAPIVALVPPVDTSAHRPARSDSDADLQICNICGGRQFGAGPRERLSATGLPPRCERCQSLERHRALRRFYDRLRGRLDTSVMTCLQISEDRCVKPEWFASHAVSIFGKSHTIDIQSIAMPSRQFDCVICNHVLEHVPDDVAAIGELYRMVTDRGFVQIGVPDPIRRSKTTDWGYARAEDHGHFRFYGPDIAIKFRAAAEGSFFARVVEVDPVTSSPDMYFILTRSPSIVSILAELYPEAEIEQIQAGKAKPVVSAEVLLSGPRPHHPSPPPRLHASETLRDVAAFTAYVEEGRYAEVEGWADEAPLSAAIMFSALQRSLGISGHVCEVGVHHGRFAIALSLLRRLGEKTLAIDVFENQRLNVDQSGRGDHDIFMANVRKWLGADHDVLTLKADSLQVSPRELIARLGGRVRLFSVDGSHTCQHTLNDMVLAESVLVPGGLAIVGGFFDPAWPGVAEAVVRYLDQPERETKLVPIACGDNKLYLTTKQAAAGYREFLSRPVRPLLNRFKPVSLCSRDMLEISLKTPAEVLTAPLIDAGETITFGKDGRGFLFGDWHRAEAAGCWSGPRAAGTAFKVAPTEDREITLQCDLGALVHSARPNPSVDAWVNGRFFATAGFDAETSRCKLNLNIETSSLAADRRVELWLSNPDAFSPAEADISADPRRLGVMLSSIRWLHQAEIDRSVASA